MAKAEQTKSYEVEMAHTTGSGAKKTMWRAGRQFEVKVPQLLDLTPAEVEAFEDDKRFSIKEASELSSQADESDETTSSDSDSSDESDNAEDTSTDESSEEDSESEDSSSDEAEEASDDSTEVSEDTESQVDSEEVTVDQLVKDNSRAELNALAKETGIENPEALAGKPEVAQAIVDAKAHNPAEEATS